MVTLKQIRVAALSCIAAVAMVFGLGISPAQAAFTSLCTGYDSCSRQGMSNYGYQASSSTSYWRMTPGHNCTNYVAYRLVKNGMPNTRPWSSTGNAYNWGIANAAKTNKTPTVGSVAWWGANAAPMGASGHVAYVEKVVSADEIIISEDNWGGDFHWRRVTRASYWPSGFIHFKDVKADSSWTYTVRSSRRR